MHTEILVVDDNNINVIYLQTMLSKLGYTSDAAADGHAAIALCQQSADKATPYDLILMDIRMDGLDGIEATKILRQIPAYRKVPVIAVSAELLPDEASNLFQQTLIKPLNKEMLENLLVDYLQVTETTTVVNQDKAMAAVNNQSEILNQLHAMLSQQLPEEIQALKKIAQANDVNGMRQQLHHMLGSAKMCYVEEIEKAILNLQKALMNEQTTQHPELILALEQATMRFQQYHQQKMSEAT